MHASKEFVIRSGDKVLLMPQHVTRVVNSTNISLKITFTNSSIIIADASKKFVPLEIALSDCECIS